MHGDAYLEGDRTIRIIVLVAFLALWNPGIAQDLVITNARVIDGTGATPENGAVVVMDGRIVSVANGGGDGPGHQIDAQGMSVRPGLIDTHRHDLKPDRLENDTKRSGVRS